MHNKINSYISFSEHFKIIKQFEQAYEENDESTFNKLNSIYPNIAWDFLEIKRKEKQDFSKLLRSQQVSSSLAY